MSGPTLGRLMKAELGNKFISANLPMLHTRTLDATDEAEFRPGVVTQADTVDLSDEFERQFMGDVMLFSVEKLAMQGYPQQDLSPDAIVATLDDVHADLVQKYSARHEKIGAKLEALTHLLNTSTCWWHTPERTQALTHFQQFIDNMQRNFGTNSPGDQFIASPVHWQAWRARLLEALTGLQADRRVWGQALASLTPNP